MATSLSILAWEIPWTEEPGGLQSTGLQRARHSWATEHICMSPTHEQLLFPHVLLSCPQVCAPIFSQILLAIISFTPVLHIQGHYFSNSSLFSPLHYWIFSFSAEIAPSAYKILLYCFFSHLKKTLLAILTSLPATNLVAPLATKSLKELSLFTFFKFPFYHSLLNTIQSIVWPRQPSKTDLIMVIDDLCIAGLVFIQLTP